MDSDCFHFGAIVDNRECFQFARPYKGRCRICAPVTSPALLGTCWAPSARKSLQLGAHLQLQVSGAAASGLLGRQVEGMKSSHPKTVCWRIQEWLVTISFSAV